MSIFKNIKTLILCKINGEPQIKESIVKINLPFLEYFELDDSRSLDLFTGLKSLKRLLLKKFFGKFDDYDEIKNIHSLSIPAKPDIKFLSIFENLRSLKFQCIC